MSRLKSVFIFLYWCYLPLGLILSIAGFAANPEAVSWYAAILSHLAGMGWFVYLYTTRLRNASILALVNTVLSGIAFLIALGQFKIEGTVGADVVWLNGIAFGGWLLYHLWYAKLGKRTLRIGIGDTLTQPIFRNGAGLELDLRQIPGKKLLVFHRGNWCPFCVEQLNELALNYDKLRDHKVTVVAVSPHETRFNEALAKRIGVDFYFVQDPGMMLSSALGLSRPHSLPMGLQVLGYESDLISPAVILLDEELSVLATYQSKDYRVRPNTAYFMRYLE